MNESLRSNGEKTGRFARFAARFSLLAPVIAIFIYVVLYLFMQSGKTRISAMAAIGSLALIVLFSGFILGAFALTRTTKYGRKGIFGKALAGVCINGVLLLSIVIGPLLIARAVTKDSPHTPQARLDVALQKLEAASAAEDRFHALDDAAKKSFVAGKTDDARKYATELLALAPNFMADWNYGNAIQDGNLVLGRIAVKEGRIEEAKKFLLAAGSSRGSPSMNSFGPNMSLAKDLLEKGERETVLQYFELCRRFWEMDHGQLDDWSQQVKAGKIPKFGANLVY